MTIHSASPVSPTDSPARGIDRRQLIKAGAWAAPVLLVTVAAPAASASGGNWGDYFEWTVNPTLVSDNAFSFAVNYALLRNISAQTVTGSLSFTASPVPSGGWSSHVYNPGGGAFSASPGSTFQFGGQGQAAWPGLPNTLLTVTLTAIITSVTPHVTVTYPLGTVTTPAS